MTDCIKEVNDNIVYLKLDKAEKCSLCSKAGEEALAKRIVALTQPLDNTGEVSFEDMFNLNGIQRLQDDFSATTGVVSIITQVDGTPITKPSNFSTHIRVMFHQLNLKSVFFGITGCLAKPGRSHVKTK